MRLKPKASEILRAYSTNVAQASRTAFIDIKGRIVAVAYLIHLSEDECRCIVHRNHAQQLTDHLSPFLPLFDADIRMESLNVFLLTADDLSEPESGSVDIGIGKLVIADHVEDALDFYDDAFTEYRIERRYPIHGVDYTDTMILNVPGLLEHISFDKGCYLGQEVVARVHYKGSPPKVLSTVHVTSLSDKDRGAATSVVRIGKTGELTGFFLTPNRSA